MTTDNELRGARELAAEARAKYEATAADEPNWPLHVSLWAPLGRQTLALVDAIDSLADRLDAVEVERQEAVELLRRARPCIVYEPDIANTVAAFLARVEEES